MSITCLVFVHLSFLFTTLSIYLVIKYMFLSIGQSKRQKNHLHWPEARDNVNIVCIQSARPLPMIKHAYVI